MTQCCMCQDTNWNLEILADRQRASRLYIHIPVTSRPSTMTPSWRNPKQVLSGQLMEAREADQKKTVTTWLVNHYSSDMICFDRSRWERVKLCEVGNWTCVRTNTQPYTPAHTQTHTHIHTHTHRYPSIHTGTHWWKLANNGCVYTHICMQCAFTYMSIFRTHVSKSTHLSNIFKMHMPIRPAWCVRFKAMPYYKELSRPAYWMIAWMFIGMLHVRWLAIIWHVMQWSYLDADESNFTNI